MEKPYLSLEMDIELQKKKPKKIFMSVPMSGFVEEADYVEFREKILEVVVELEKLNSCSSVFFAGKESKKGMIHTPKDSFESDLVEIDDCDLFVLIFPKKIVTSALVEIGYAIAKKKKILVFVRDLDDLPYMLREFDKAYENGSLYSFENFDFITEKLYQLIT